MNNPSSASSAPPVGSAGSDLLVSSPARRAVPWLGILALMLSVLALMGSGLLWQRLGFTQKEFSQRAQESTGQSSETRRVAEQAEAQVQELQARLAVAEVRLSEVSLQRSQLEELMLALSRSRDDNLVQDLESALRLGQQQSQLTGSVLPLLAALQAADERIGRAAQPRLNPVQRAIARDVQRIRSTTVVDVPSQVHRLDELARYVDRWPLLNDPRLADAWAVPIQAQPSASAQVAEPAAGSAEAAPSEPMTTSGWTRVSQAWSSLAQRIWDHMTRSGQELVRVSRIDQPEAALLAPDQAFFLRENLKLRVLNARLGVLGRQTEAVQEDLQGIDTALSRYFVQDAPEVLAAKALVSQLRTELVSQSMPQPEDSLAALAVAAGGR